MDSIQKQLDEENKKKKDYEEFKNSKKYKWYLDLQGSDRFRELLRWKVVFEDDFSAPKLDTEKWITRYYWGDKLIDDAYALENDKAFPTDGKNIETGGTLKITTKREKVSGKIWKLPFGFIPQDFDYSTGLISTARSFRQKYGRIEAKIKVNYAKPVNYNFWMASEKNLPHVDILKLQQKKSKVNVGHVYGDVSGKASPSKQSSQFSGLDVSQDFFIYTLDWSKDKLTWKINDVVVHERSTNIPEEEMYLVFSSGITAKPSDAGLPASMEVDWVRCYQEV
jgi:beta-glucanase (GH16 family)